MRLWSEVKMNDSKKSLGVLLAGLGILLMGISSITFALKGCSNMNTKQHETVTAEESFEEAMAEAKKTFDDPAFQKMLQENLKKALSEVEVKETEIEIRK
jgi:hypothetical protein